jgi:monothiol glutaredoxin
MKIKAYVSGRCAWSGGICAVLEKYKLSYEKLDVSTDPKALAEMTRRTGQMNTPCVEVNGVMLIDVCGQEVEDYLLSRELVGVRPVHKTEPDAPHAAGARLAEAKRFF